MNTLHIHPFRVWVRLGCQESERANVQPVDISVEITFPKMPGACVSDDLTQTIDYSIFVTVARELAAKMEFKLVEFLAYTLHDAFEKIVADQAKITVTVHKLHPPVDGMTNGVSFVFSK
jgi:dihydroneopterin aldolase